MPRSRMPVPSPPRRICSRRWSRSWRGRAAAGLTACELEDLLAERGREVQRQLLQDHLDLRAAREEQAAREHRVPAAGADGITRNRVETGHQQAAGHAVRHGAGHPVRLAPAGGTQPLPGRCRLVAAGLPSVPCPGPAGRGGGGARLVRGRARGDHPPLRAGDRQAAGRAGGGERRRRHRRVLRRPGPGAVHRLDAAGDLRRRQGDRDAARGRCARTPPKPPPARAGCGPGWPPGRNPTASGWPPWPASTTPSRPRAARTTSSPRPAGGTAAARCGPGPKRRRNGWPDRCGTTRPS